jgi:hypothetical protein
MESWFEIHLRERVTVKFKYGTRADMDGFTGYINAVYKGNIPAVEMGLDEVSMIFPLDIVAKAFIPKSKDKKGKEE